MTDMTDALGRRIGARVDGSLPASLGVVVLAGAGLTLAARTSALALLVAVALAQALLAFAWVFGTAMPGRWGGVLLAGLAAAGSDVCVSVWPHSRLGTLLAVLGLAVPALFVHQLCRGAARVQIVRSLSAIATLVLAEVSLAVWPQLRHEFFDAGVGSRVVAASVAAVAAALAAGYLADLLLPVLRFDPAVPRGLPALLLAIGVGAAVGWAMLRGVDGFVDGRVALAGAALGALAGLLALAAAFVSFSSPEPASAAGRALQPVLAALLPMAVLAPVAFLMYLSVRT